MSIKAAERGFGVAVDEHDSPFPFQVGQFVGQVIPAIQRGLVPSAPAVPHPSGPPAGRIFQMIEEGHLREEVSFHRNRISFASGRYDGWVLFLERLADMIGDAQTEVGDLVSTALLRLEYWDRFIFDGPTDQARYSDVLEVGSRYIPGFPNETAELWHSHIGYFLPETALGRCLINVNVDTADIPDRVVNLDPSVPSTLKRSVGIYSLAQQSLATTAAASTSAEISAIADELHSTLNKVFAGVINKEMNVRIGLQPESGL